MLSDESALEDEPASVESGKDLFQQMIRQSSADVVQEGWSRIVRFEVKTVSEQAPRHKIQPLTLLPVSPRQKPPETAHVDPKQIAAFITSGGRKAVVKILRALRDRGVNSDAVRLFEEALAEAMQSTRREPSSKNLRPANQSDSFVDRARRLDATGRTDLALDLLYDAIDQMLREARFEELDAIIAGLPIAECSLNLLLGFLTATLPARTRLPVRPRFFAEVKTELQNRGEFEEGLLTGLE
jgi:hypothetical protein